MSDDIKQAHLRKRNAANAKAYRDRHPERASESRRKSDDVRRQRTATATPKQAEPKARAVKKAAPEPAGNKSLRPFFGKTRIADTPRAIRLRELYHQWVEQKRDR